ncbi:MAG: glycosyltransferase [Moraxellaceae bacterium]|jgi:glycosyltransferase involved in cell wall biosynthesis|nr:glycosyltransferase [Moraxellaceae bacterium]
MRVLHISVHYNLPPGVFQQMQDEARAARTLAPDVQWDTRVFAVQCEHRGEPLTLLSETPPTSVLGRLTAYVRLRLMAFAWLRRVASSYDIVLVRHGMGDVFEGWCAAQLQNWVSVHHTHEMEEAALLGGWRSILRTRLERWSGNRVLGHARAIIGVTGELGRIEQARIAAPRPVFVYPNGIDLAGMPLAEDRREGPPRLLFVCSVFASWHGLESVLRALKDVKDDFVLDVVGFAYPEQRAMVAGDPRFVFHGRLKAPQIAALTALADIGLSSFALHEKAMAEACTLKVREYLASGLPVYAHHRDAGLPDDFRFYRNAAAAAAGLLGFAQEMRRVPRAEVRAAAAGFIDKSALMRRLANELDASLRADRAATNTRKLP